MISREDLVEQSVTNFIRNAIFTLRSYPPDQVELLESFPYDLKGELPKNYIATGFNFDDDGTQAELGSDLMRRVYTLEFFVFGRTRTFAKNLANVVKFAFQAEGGTIPLLDISQAGTPEIDRLVVLGASTDRQVVPDPQPWQEFIWLTTANVEDTYHAALV